jgi:arylsulfatase A-like enzyme
MNAIKNILWIMCDQLRWDYLSCYGHPHLSTPNVDWLASRGVRFQRAYVQSAVCGPSRMSAYTGRYVRTHGSPWNGAPLRIGEPTLGDHLRELRMRCVLIGKTHMVPDRPGMARLGVDAASIEGVYAAQCGFEPFERDDGLHPGREYGPAPAYDDFLRHQGYEAANPWHDWANAADDGQGGLASGWFLKHADKPARVPADLSETAYMTRRAIAFMDEAEKTEQPWLCHLSYIKPHWPYIAPAPYHRLYSAADIQPPIRSAAEKADPHPLFRAFMDERYSLNFSRDEVRVRVIPAYMGLIRQIDDELGALFAFMREAGLLETTMIVFTSDHGDYLGDHWLGEKYLFHDQSVRVPLIVFDPDPTADVTRGTVCDALVEMIDLAPTFLDALGGMEKPHILEGRSLLPLLRGNCTEGWRAAAFSELDYSRERARLALGVSITDSRATMVCDGRWKYVHVPKHRPMLFDLENDPQEINDLGGDPSYEDECARLHALLFDWTRRPATRVTVSDQQIMSSDEAPASADPAAKAGIWIGYWDEIEAAEQQGEKGTDAPPDADSAV